MWAPEAAQLLMKQLKFKGAASPKLQTPLYKCCIQVMQSHTGDFKDPVCSYISDYVLCRTMRCGTGCNTHQNLRCRTLEQSIT